MSRACLAAVLGGGLVLVLAVPARPAPGPKPSDKPEAPPTPAQFDQSSNNLKQIGLAIHNFHDVNGRLPANLLTKDGKPGLSWRIHLLPYIEETPLYKEFRQDEPWDSEHNKKLVERIPKLFAPVRGKAEKEFTYYQMFAGPGTLLDPDGKGITFADVTDGLSNTLMVVEAEKPVVWTKPDDIPFDGKAVPKLGGQFGGEFHALFGDGVVRRVPRGMPAEVMIRAIGRADGLVVDFEAEAEKVRESK